MNKRLCSIVIPCYNEERYLATCVERIRAIAPHCPDLAFEIIIVDDCSTDSSPAIAKKLSDDFSDVRMLRHPENRGKGAALRTGMADAKGDFICIQDSDLEYNPIDLIDLLKPLQQGKADVVFGSRYVNANSRRILYFWHSSMNRALTLLSNTFTDLDMTDMECCYKAFTKEALVGVEIEEQRFGFEPEIVAKIAQKRLRVYETAVSYSPRTYAEGKKIRWKDGVRALYCIFRYSAHKAPAFLQFFIYLAIGSTAALCNLLLFLLLIHWTTPLAGALLAYSGAAALNYWLSIKILFRHKARWGSATELLMYILVVSFGAALDAATTTSLIGLGLLPSVAKIAASMLGLCVNFLGRRYLVFREAPPGPWNT